ncbi:hypothetical protein BpHYR1_027703 [Brachionus plicatilis]|uniref:Uncharacterized protein n=1 Tax=Brachionus plicatilis TaxID=10195 RepID=A0A3M7QXR6_BRAPC|nr:hypothetical protein BpHYR1_027703 [Brachionus plicatilis]
MMKAKKCVVKALFLIKLIKNFVIKKRLEANIPQKNLPFKISCKFFESGVTDAPKYLFFYLPYTLARYCMQLNPKLILSACIPYHLSNDFGLNAGTKIGKNRKN